MSLIPQLENVIDLVSSRGEPFDNHICAAVLNATFVNHFSPHKSTHVPDVHHHNYLGVPPVTVHPAGVAQLFNTLKNRTSPGHDTVHAKFLKNTLVLVAQLF